MPSPDTRDAMRLATFARFGRHRFIPMVYEAVDWRMYTCNRIVDILARLPFLYMARGMGLATQASCSAFGYSD